MRKNWTREYLSGRTSRRDFVERAAVSGLSFAATHMGSMYLIFELAPHAIRARAQGWLAAAVAGVSAATVTLSGPLYAGFGEVAYLAMAGLAAAGVALAVVVGSARRSR